MTTLPQTFGDLKRSPWADAPLRSRPVRDELRGNLLRLLHQGAPLFPGIVGYEDTILPQLTTPSWRAITSSSSGSGGRPRAASSGS